MGASTPASRKLAETGRGGRVGRRGVGAPGVRRSRGGWLVAAAFGLSASCAGRPSSPPPTSEPRPTEPAPAASAAPLELSPPAPPPPRSPSDRAVEAGDAALELGRLDVARQEYERALSLAPASPRGALGLLRLRFTELGLGNAYADAPDHPGLRALLAELDGLLREHPGDAAAQLERARWSIVLGDAPHALPSARLAVQLGPELPDAHSVLGVAQLATGQSQAAVESLEAANRLGPGDPDRLVNLGTAYMLRGRVSDAVRAFRSAAALDPSDARAFGDLGAALLADGRPDEALPHLLRATQLAPERATFVTNLGYAYQKRGELARAIETQRRAIAIDPELGSAWINLGNALAEQGDYAGAAAALRRAEVLDPSDPRPKASLRDLAEVEARPRPSAP